MTEASVTVDLPLGKYLLLVAARDPYHLLDRGSVTQTPETRRFKRGNMRRSSFLCALSFQIRG